MATTKQAPPEGLKDAGRQLWQEIVAEYELRADELRVLREAAFTIDLIDVMKSELETDSVMIPGSMGQRVVNPLITELRQYRSALTLLLRQLNLPDVDGGEAEQKSRSTAARTAANARWSRRGQSA